MTIIYKTFEKYTQASTRCDMFYESALLLPHSVRHTYTHTHTHAIRIDWPYMCDECLCPLVGYFAPPPLTYTYIQLYCIYLCICVCQKHGFVRNDVAEPHIKLKLYEFINTVKVAEMLWKALWRSIYKAWRFLCVCAHACVCCW